MTSRKDDRVFKQVETNPQFNAVKKVFSVQHLKIYIFHFLHFTTLLRCKCVSKQWKEDANDPAAIKYVIILPEIIKKAIGHKFKVKFTRGTSSNDVIKVIEEKHNHWWYQHVYNNTNPKDKLMDSIHSLRFYTYNRIMIDHNLLSIRILLPLLCESYAYDYDYGDIPVSKSRIKEIYILTGLSSTDHDAMWHWFYVLNKICFVRLKLFKIVLARILLDNDKEMITQKPRYEIINIKSNNSVILYSYQIHANVSNLNAYDALLSKHMIAQHHRKTSTILNASPRIISTNDAWFDYNWISKLVCPTNSKIDYEHDNTKIFENSKVTSRSYKDPWPVEYSFKTYDNKKSQEIYPFSYWRLYLHSVNRLEQLYDKITQWDNFLDKNLGICNFEHNLNQEMKIDAIILSLVINHDNVQRSNLWFKVSLDLNKSKLLVGCFEILYKWYKLKQTKNICVECILIFEITHVNEEVINAYRDHGLMINFARNANWIKLVIKALTTVFKIEKHHNVDFNCANKMYHNKSVRIKGFYRDKKKTFVVYDEMIVNETIKINLRQHYQPNAIENGVTNELKIIFSS